MHVQLHVEMVCMCCSSAHKQVEAAYAARLGIPGPRGNRYTARLGFGIHGRAGDGKPHELHLHRLVLWADEVVWLQVADSPAVVMIRLVPLLVAVLPPSVVALVASLAAGHLPRVQPRLRVVHRIPLYVCKSLQFFSFFGLLSLASPARPSRLQ